MKKTTSLLSAMIFIALVSTAFAADTTVQAGAAGQIIVIEHYGS